MIIRVDEGPDGRWHATIDSFRGKDSRFFQEAYSSHGCTPEEAVCNAVRLKRHEELKLDPDRSTHYDGYQVRTCPRCRRLAQMRPGDVVCCVGRRTGVQLVEDLLAFFEPMPKPPLWRDDSAWDIWESEVAKWRGRHDASKASLRKLAREEA